MTSSEFPSRSKTLHAHDPREVSQRCDCRSLPAAEAGGRVGGRGRSQRVEVAEWRKVWAFVGAVSWRSADGLVCVWGRVEWRAVVQGEGMVHIARKIQFLVSARVRTLRVLRVWVAGWGRVRGGCKGGIIMFVNVIPSYLLEREFFFLSPRCIIHVYMFLRMWV